MSSRNSMLPGLVEFAIGPATTNGTVMAGFPSRDNGREFENSSASLAQKAPGNDQPGTYCGVKQSWMSFIRNVHIDSNPCFRAKLHDMRNPSVPCSINDFKLLFAKVPSRDKNTSAT